MLLPNQIFHKFRREQAPALRQTWCDASASKALLLRLWYNKHNTKDEKRDRFSVMCLLNRSEASRFAACTYGIMIAGRFANKLSGKTNVGKGLAPSESNLSQPSAGASPRPTDKPGATGRVKKHCFCVCGIIKPKLFR